MLIITIIRNNNNFYPFSLITMQRIPVAYHPGGLLLKALESRKRSQSYFAQLINKTNTEVSQLINGKRNITLDRAIRLATALETTEEFWLKMQIAYDRYQWYKQEQNQQLFNLIKYRVWSAVPA